MNVTDTAFIGRVGEIELGAAALGGIFYFVLIMLGTGFGTGVQIIIARKIGEGQRSLVGKILDQAIYFMLPLSLLILLLSYLFIDSWLQPLIESKEVYTATMAYLYYRMPGLLFAFGQIIFRSFYIGLADTKVLTWSTLVMAGVNIVLDYGLIFGNLGFPEMGISGAALASSISEVAAFIFLIVYTYRKKFVSNYQLFHFTKPDKEIFNSNLKLSYPLMIQNFLSLGVWFVFFLLVEKMGEQELAISNIIRSVYIVLMIPIWGFASAANSLTSYLIGNQRAHLIFKLTGRIVLMCMGGVSAFLVASFIFPAEILSVYTDNQSLIKHSIPVLYVVNFGALSLSAGFVLFNTLLGTGKTKAGLFIEMIVLAIYLGFVYLIVSVIKGDITAVWISEFVYGVFISLLSWMYLKWLFRKEYSLKRGLD
ncbi:MAG: MATE family efflux transporter [Bacteroidales bacterium]|nr:MATE family efflux transporter [Bacteroidales bacterium]